MAITTIKLEGIADLVATSKSFFAQMVKANSGIIVKEGKRLAHQMQVVAPHDKNNIRKAIESRVYATPKRGVIGVVVGITREMSRRHPEFRVGKDGQGWYPAYQEYGFFDRSGKYIRNSFLRPIMLANRSLIKRNVKNTYNRVIKNRSEWGGRLR